MSTHYYYYSISNASGAGRMDHQSSTMPGGEGEHGNRMPSAPLLMICFKPFEFCAQFLGITC